MSGLTASECPHPGAVEHVHTISVPLNRATLVLCLLLHESSTFATVLRTSSKLHQTIDTIYGCTLMTTRHCR